MYKERIAQAPLLLKFPVFENGEIVTMENSTPEATVIPPRAVIKVDNKLALAGECGYFPTFWESGDMSGFLSQDDVEHYTKLRYMEFIAMQVSGNAPVHLYQLTESGAYQPPVHDVIPAKATFFCSTEVAGVALLHGAMSNFYLVRYPLEDSTMQGYLPESVVKNNSKMLNFD